MTTPETLKRISTYFGGDGKPYNTEVISEMGKVFERLNDDDRDKIFARLVEEEKASFKVSVKEVVAACQFLGIPYHQARRFDAIDWECDACGRQFRYAMCTDSEDRLNGVFDFCPRCGFQPGWTKTIMAYAEQGAVTPGHEEWYREMRDKTKEKYKPGNDPYWSPAAERDGMADVEKRKRERLAQIMDLLGGQIIRKPADIRRPVTADRSQP